MLDFILSPEQQATRAASASFAAGVLSTARANYEKYPDQRSRFLSLQPIYRIAVEGGMIAAQIPKALGGKGGPLLDSALLLEEVYAADPSATITIAGTGLGLLPLLFGGTKEQQTRLLKPFLSGEGTPLASLVHSEPQGTANWLQKGAPGLSTWAREDGDDWVLNGEKLWTTNSGGWTGEGADLQCVCCRASPDGRPQDPNADPRDAIMILMVTPEIIKNNAPGAYTMLSEPELSGHIAASGPHSRFSNLRVPKANVLGTPGQAAQIIESAFAATAAMVGAISVSIMRAAFEAALAFAKSDSRGGTVPIIDHQSVADLLIDIKTRTEASRLMTWKALHGLDNGPGDAAASLELALETKFFCSDNAVKSCVDAMKLVGMSSYTKTLPFSNLLNDAMVLPLFDGGNVGVRRRQLEQIFKQAGYQPWAATFGPEAPSKSTINPREKVNAQESIRRAIQ